MSSFVRHDEKFFQANAFLEPKKSRQKITPSHVQYERDEKGQLVTTAIFSSRRKRRGRSHDRPGRKKRRVQLQALGLDTARQLRASEDGGQHRPGPLIPVSFDIIHRLAACPDCGRIALEAYTAFQQCFSASVCMVF